MTDIHDTRNRCGHTYCSDCTKRRGSNIGNRVKRHNTRRIIRELVKTTR